MLLRFKFSNTLSFQAEQELSLVAAPLADGAKGILRPAAVKAGVLPVVGIYGANASGKTNVIKALSFMDSAVEDSYRRWKPDGAIPRRAFRLSAQAASAPSSFVIDFLIDGIRHQYGFVVDSNAVLDEWLYVYPNNKRQAWFVRRHGKSIAFGAKLPGANRTIEELTRPNSLFLSTAAQNNHEALKRVYKWFSDQLNYVDADRFRLLERTAELCLDEGFRGIVSRILKQADLGIAGINVRKEALPDRFLPAIKAFLSELKRPSETEELPDLSEVTRPAVEFLHHGERGLVPFPLSQESRGTSVFWSLLGPIVEALNAGAVIAVDELDAHLHPLLALRLIELFQSPQYNGSGAQLIFTTHNTNLLKALRRDQIWFTEKDDAGRSTLYPLTDFKPRQDENLQNGYLQGRYGAIPFVDSEGLWKTFETTHAEKQ
jgi:hypothetical protein